MKVYRGSAVPVEIYNKLRFDAFGKVIPDSLKGVEVIEQGFMSTSKHPGTAFNFALNELFSADPGKPVKAVIREIAAPAGAKGADISAISEFVHEYEILFARGQTTIIKDAFLDESGILHTIEEIVLR
jgi:hypothetical protein